MRILPTRCHFNGKCVCTAYKFTKLFSRSIRDNAKPDIVIFFMASEIKYFQATALPDSEEPSSALSRLVIYHTSLISAHNITSSAIFVPTL